MITGTCRTVLTKYPNGYPLFAPFVRWRKRRWAPKAESKEFYVRQKPPHDPEEYAELAERFRPYKTYIKSLRNYMRQELREQKAITASGELKRGEQRQYQYLLGLNDQWNEKTKKMREEREVRDAAKEQEEILQYTIALEQEKVKQMAVADSRVKLEQEASQYFITAENLEQGIEKALNKTINYNFYIDVKGNRYVEKADFSGELTSYDIDPEPQVFSSRTQGEGHETVST